MLGARFKRQTRQAGFTLIELMMVAAILAILAGIALPSYQNYVKKSRIAEATSVLADYRVKLEQFYQDNRTYAGFTCPNGAINSPSTFAVTCPTLSATAYTVTATGSGAMASFVYNINQSNVRSSTTPWGNNTTCWVTGSGGQC